MNKELKALQKLRDLVEYLTRIDYVPTALRNEVKELLIKHYEDSNGYFSQIEKALNELECAKHNYRAMEERFTNVVAYSTKIQKELNELKKRNEPKKVNIIATHDKIGLQFGSCSNCGNLTKSHYRKGKTISLVDGLFCSTCGQRLDWSDEDD